MKITKVKDYIYQYQFKDSEDNPFYGVNIIVLVDAKSALIIDTAYSKHAKKVKEDLIGKGITPKVIVLSHYHPDHIDGTNDFKGCKFVGSKEYKFNLDNCKMWFPDREYIEPDVLIEEQGTLEFGDHRLEFIHTPGHSKCSMTTVINNEIIHVGDLLMRTTDGREMLPYVCMDGGYDEHMSSLQKVLDLGKDMVLVAHGDPIEGESEIKKQIEDRIYYLEKVKESNGKLSVEDCLKYDKSNYSSLNFHEKNIQHF